MKFCQIRFVFRAPLLEWPICLLFVFSAFPFCLFPLPIPLTNFSAFQKLRHRFGIQGHFGRIIELRRKFWIQQKFGYQVVRVSVSTWPRLTRVFLTQIVLKMSISQCFSTFFKLRNLWNIIELLAEPRY